MDTKLKTNRKGNIIKVVISIVFLCAGLFSAMYIALMKYEAITYYYQPDSHYYDKGPLANTYDMTYAFHTYLTYVDKEQEDLTLDQMKYFKEAQEKIAEFEAKGYYYLITEGNTGDIIKQNSSGDQFSTVAELFNYSEDVVSHAISDYYQIFEVYSNFTGELIGEYSERRLVDEDYFEDVEKYYDNDSVKDIVGTDIDFSQTAIDDTIYIQESGRESVIWALNIGVSAEQMANYYVDYEKEIGNGETYLIIAFSTFGIFIIGIILTIVFAGKKDEHGEIIMKKYDKFPADIFTIIYLTAMIASVLLATNYIAVELYNRNFRGYDSNDPHVLDEIILAISVIGSLGLGLLSYLYFSFFSRNVKNGTLIKNTLIYIIFKYLFKAIKFIFKLVSFPFTMEFIKSIKIKLALGYSLILQFIWIFVILISPSSYMGIGAVLVLLFIFYILILGLYMWTLYLLKDLNHIKKGANEIRNGNYSYKIPESKQGDINDFVQDINNIGEGLSVAVKNATASQKMKTELITNVSHDLKTPLTSIISYVDLLSKEEMSEVCTDYVNVIKTKSDRLNAIVSDVFLLSKTASGVSEVEMENIDLVKLVNQTIAEMSQKIEESNRSLKLRLLDKAIIYADGKKMYRVMQNLIDNAIKYSLENTRIHINIIEKDGFFHLEVLNIANYEMDFSEEAAMQRFSRGDASRTTEGNGLGLSIAQSFTEVCGGQFKIKIDGDNFKATVIFEGLTSSPD